jgi:formylglycine-generating enzyme required for sulfatase activity
MALALAAALVALWFWQTRTPDFGDVVEVPAGVYQFTDPSGATLEASLAGFAIDRTEVTNRDYAACYAAGACPYPASIDAADRESYFLDAQFATYPVVNIAWDAANAYCQWREMRLPSIAEFEVAARYAPLTDRYYRFPWGDIFSSAFLVSAETFDRAAAAASRSPQGDSPLGVADLAGNVSEWTVTSPAEAPQLAYIKGGSWRDGYSTESTLLPAVSQTYPKTDSAPWLGFRCIAPLP